MPKVLPEYLEQRRQQILDGAAACFARRGFHQATMQDICDEAGLSPGAVYRYFRSKEEIIEAMCERGMSRDVDKIRSTMDQGETLDVFNELIRVFFVSQPDEYCALNLELTAEVRRNEFVRQARQRLGREISGALAEIVRSAQAKGEINPLLDAEAVARVMSSLYQGLLIQQLIDPDLDVERYADVTRALFAGGFWLAKEPSSPADQAPRNGVAALRH